MPTATYPSSCNWAATRAPRLRDADIWKARGIDASSREQLLDLLRPVVAKPFFGPRRSSEVWEFHRW